MNILEEANQLTKHDRQDVYGHPYDEFEKIAIMSAPIMESGIDPRLKHALYMIIVKIVRLLQTPEHRDSLVDIPGYANTYDMVLEKMKQNKKS